MRIAHTKIALFALFLVAPVIALLLFGPADSYGRPQTRFPAVGKVLLGNKGRFDQFGDAVLERSEARRLAIQLRNWVSYRLVGFVDNEHVVSGNGGWLFYRADFTGGRCLDEDHAAQRLRGLAVLIDTAKAAGIDMFVSLSPDKSTIYPEALSTMVRGYWKCRMENIAALRRIIKREVPALIDHADALLAEKARNPGVPLYYETDTHWTSYGGAIALRQLLATLYPGVETSPPRLSDSVRSRSTDLPKLLLLTIKEQATSVEPLMEEDLGSEIADQPAPAMLVVHDSFYGHIRSQLRDLFPRNTVFRSVGKDDPIGEDVMTADRLIINLVERTLLMQFDKELSWDAPVPIAIVTRNMRRAERCDWFEEADAESRVAQADAHFLDVTVPAVAADHLPCLRLSLSAAKPDILRIALPRADNGALEPGRAIQVGVTPATRTIALVLPGYAAGSRVRLLLEGGDGWRAISGIRAGEIPSARLASAVNGIDQP